VYYFHQPAVKAGFYSTNRRDEMRKVGFLIMLVLMLAVVPAVLAGGWAVITLDEMPGEIRPGEPWTVGFTVLQHGESPIHRFDDGSPIQPKLTATNTATGERVEATGTPTDEVGHFTVEVTFPSEGSWEWTIEPWPLIGQTIFEPLQVVAAPVAPVMSEAVVEPAVVAPVAPADEPATAPQPAVVATTPVAATSPAASLRWAALVVALAAVALLAIQSRKRAAPQPQVES
jgi:hypothetical protein